MNILLSFLKTMSRYESDKYNAYLEYLTLDTENHYYFINPYSGRNIINNKLPSLKNIPNLTIIDAIDDYFKVKSWAQSFTWIDHILKTYDIDRHLILYLGAMKEYRRGLNSTIEKDYIETYNNDLHKTSFNVVFRYLNRCMLAYYINNESDYALSKGITSYQMVTDPQEPDFIDRRFYFFDRESERMEWVPFVEFGFMYKQFGKWNKENEFDFTFGCTMLTRERTHMTPQVQSLKEKLNIENLKSNIYLKDKFAKIDNLVKISIYNDEVGRSKFTMIAPSYDTTHFSNIRFYEALAMDTIPLIHEDANLEDGLQHYPELRKLFRKYIVKIEDIADKIKSINYDEALAEIKANPDYIKITTNLDYYKELLTPIFKYD